MKPKRIFYLFRQTPTRESLLANTDHDQEAGAHLFYGMSYFSAPDWQVSCNLPLLYYRRVPHFLNALVNAILRKTGHLENDFYSLFCNWKKLKQADLCFATNDSVGLAPLWLRRLGLLRTPVVYTSIGMPERLQSMSARKQQRCLKLLQHASSILCYGWQEAEDLRKALAEVRNPPPVHFIPFFVDTDAFVPQARPKEVDVVSIGADRMRDVSLFLDFLRAHPHVRGLLIHDNQTRPENPPPNLKQLCDIPITEVRDWINRARIVVLPVKQNSYSGATTTLLQAMAMGATVLVAETGAIHQGYGLADSRELCFYPPGDATAFASKLIALLGDKNLRKRLSGNALGMATNNFNHHQFKLNLEKIFLETLHV